jgi:hypothetical protein
VGAKSDKNPSTDFSALLAPGGLVRPGKNYSSEEGDTGGLLEAVKYGAVPLKATPDKAPQARTPGERILSCADCDFHRYSGPNPAHGWGRCTFTGKGCYGLRAACKDISGTIQSQEDVFLKKG